jgi:hypothetical protein
MRLKLKHDDPLLSFTFNFNLRRYSKVPGLGMRLDQTDLDLQYKKKDGADLPDAYERLILDVVGRCRLWGIGLHGLRSRV